MALPAPTPRLQLRTERLLVDNSDGLVPCYDELDLPVLELGFRYGAITVPAKRCEGEELERNVVVENQARQVLERLGAVEIDCLEGCEPAFDSHADYVVRLDRDVHACCTFSVQALRQLRAQGWEVEIAEDYPFRVLGESTWYAEIEPAEGQLDWFGLELGVTVDHQRINLLPALLELLERCPTAGRLDELLRGSPECYALPVGDNTFLPIPVARLQRVLLVLRDLYEQRSTTPVQHARRGMLRLTTPHQLRLSRGQARALGAIDRALCEDGLQWQGEQELLELGRALHDGPTLGQTTRPSGLRATLRAYQREGVQWLQHLRSLGFGGILADDMGLGKTLQTIAHLLAEQEAGRLERPALIVSPTSLVANWQREIYRFAPCLRPLVLHGPQRRRRFWHIDRSAVVITSYPLLWRDRAQYAERPFSVLVLDEAQTIKNRASQLHRAVRQVQAETSIALSGTPLENHLGELHALFDVVVPGLLGTAEAFRHSFRQPIEAGDDERLAQLRRRLAPFFLRRLKTDVAPELPPKTEIIRPIELPEEQRELYESIRVAAHADVRRLIRVKGLAAATVPVLDALMKLRQVCCDPRLVRVPAARQVHASAKYDLLIDLVTEQTAQGRRILIFSQFASMLELIAEGLERAEVAYVLLTGATTQRQERIDAFQQGQVQVFLISLKAGGTGLTLTEADTVIHYDPWWNPAAQDQATDRAYRIGQRKPVFVYKLVVAGSVEERMLQLQARKQHLADAVLGAPGVVRLLDVDEVDDLFAPLGS